MNLYNRVKKIAEDPSTQEEIIDLVLQVVEYILPEETHDLTNQPRENKLREYIDERLDELGIIV